ncbi:MAG: T9SS type A sorting domain-containing protein [Bacteroidales bacterium]|nr:T9SS type A sorting domain-containing protein [Bacteroidales bacterium]
MIIDIGVLDGDSIALNDSYQPYIHVDSVRILPFGIYNEPRKHVYIKEMHSNYPFWIEGVGCLFGFLYNPAELMMVGEVNNLVCFYENDSLKYHHAYYENCFPTGIHSSTDKNQFIKDPIRVLYKPGSILIQFQEIIGPSKCFISDILGKETTIMNLQNTNSLEFQKDMLPEGFYIFVLISNQGIYSKKFLVN